LYIIIIMCFLFSDCCMESSEIRDKDRLEDLDLDTIIREFEIIRNNTTMRKNRLVQDHTIRKNQIIQNYLDTNLDKSRS
jgi:hypothetical protein